jgi:hypothetical protein
LVRKSLKPQVNPLAGHLTAVKKADILPVKPRISVFVNWHYINNLAKEQRAFCLTYVVFEQHSSEKGSAKGRGSEK